ncbi:hypothetical protein [Nocardioides convexus]|uniref:hypothetical protein n=1 Tax=Nocardioides convexus TaxID=2712224 RepID=UPI002418B52C|nr:hypothetical protein [Nocardioides convexus]
MIDDHDRRYLDLAIEQARTGWEEGGIPIGAVLVHQGEVLAVGRNRRVQARLGHPARRDRRHRERRPAAGEGLPGEHALHDPVPLLHVRGHLGPLRHPAHRGRRERQASRPPRSGCARVASWSTSPTTRPARRLMATMMREKPESVGRGHRGGVVTDTARPETAVVDPDYPVTPVPAHARKSFLSLAVVLLGFTVFTPTMLAGAQARLGVRARRPGPGDPARLARPRHLRRAARLDRRQHRPDDGRHGAVRPGPPGQQDSARSCSAAPRSAGTASSSAPSATSPPRRSPGSPTSPAPR